MINQRLSIVLVIFLVRASYGCIIHNAESGVCTYKYLPKTSEPDTLWKADMPFCGKWVAPFPPCVPSTPTDAWIAADQNFPFGRIGTSDEQVDVHSIRSKDTWIEQTVTNAMQESRRQNNYFQNKDCQDAYARYTCWINFPRCDDTGESLPVCQSGERRCS